ncbi:MAG: MurT ligase domain-containing protein, partial [Candidatus Saccharimonadaceae bacterium]|nr:MurT ligase domain-containing protein [Candidatus Saccharimonadaceae bacterium]
LWDVDFRSLVDSDVSYISGIRAYDMALRLQYDEIPFKYVDTDIKKSLSKFIKKNPGRTKRIYCTYTAMLKIRKELAKITEVEEVK